MNQLAVQSKSLSRWETRACLCQHGQSRLFARPTTGLDALLRGCHDTHGFRHLNTLRLGHSLSIRLRQPLKHPTTLKLISGFHIRDFKSHSSPQECEIVSLFATAALSNWRPLPCRDMRTRRRHTD